MDPFRHPLHQDRPTGEVWSLAGGRAPERSPARHLRLFAIARRVELRRGEPAAANPPPARIARP
jgi:hypothetical protein